MTTTLLMLINILVDTITILLFVYVITSYFLSPFHQVRQTLERIIGPMLDPIRRILPSAGGMDLSPLVLWLVLRLAGSLLSNVILAF